MITSQKIYAVLRKARYQGKNSSSRWPVVERDSDMYSIWYTITYQSYEGQSSIPRSQREDAIADFEKALSQAGITSHHYETELIVHEDQ